MLEVDMGTHGLKISQCDTEGAWICYGTKEVSSSNRCQRIRKCGVSIINNMQQWEQPEHIIAFNTSLGI